MPFSITSSTCSALVLNQINAVDSEARIALFKYAIALTHSWLTSLCGRKAVYYHIEKLHCTAAPTNYTVTARLAYLGPTATQPEPTGA